MAAPTLLTIAVDSAEYSRYESNSKIINFTITASGGGTYTSESIRVDLVKAKGDRSIIVESQTYVLNGSAPQTIENSFNLTKIVDQDGISSIRFGSYFLRVTSITDTSIVGESLDFNIRIMTVSKFKEDYLFGIRLYATEVKGIKLQPSNITGVTVTEVSKNSSSGFGTLTYTYAVGPVRTLSWKGGTAVNISAAGTYLLKAGGTGPLAALGLNSDYITVKVSALSALPLTNQTDELMIEEKQIEDSTIASYLDKAVSYVENELLWIRVEPTYIASISDSLLSADNTEYDFLETPLTYFGARKNSWLTINTPFFQILRVDSIYGVIANNKVLDIDLHWISPSYQGGMIQLVPYNQQIAFSYLSIFFSNALGHFSEVPNFWHYRMLVGLRECPPEVRDLIAKKAAIDLLGVLGAAYKPGLGSISLSRDGVSQSTSLQQGKYGPYTGIITSLKEQMDKDVIRLRAKYRGPAVLVV